MKAPLDAREIFAGVMHSVMQHADAAFNGQRPVDPEVAWQRTVGIVILTFAYGDNHSGIANYISNGADRKDIIKFLRETADRFERNDGMLGGPQPVTDKPLPSAEPEPAGPEPAGAEPEPDPELKLEEIPTLNILHADSDDDVRQLAIEGRMVEYAWEGFRRFVVPADALPGQLQDLKGTFYAGSHTMFEFISSLGELPDDETRIIPIMAGIEDELQRYAALMGAVAEANDAKDEGKLN